MSRSFVLFSVLLVAGSAYAQPAPESGVETARRLFKEAVSLEARGDWAGAEQKLREALGVKETPGLRYHLAFCQAQQGKLIEALADYDRAQALIDGGMAAPDVQALLTTARSELAPRIPELTLQIPARVPDFQALIDGQPVAVDRGTPIRINPGRHELEVRADGHQPFAVSVELSEAERRMLPVDPVPLPRSAPSRALAPVAPPPPAGAPAAGGGSAKLGLLIGEAGVVVVGLGIGFWGLAARGSAADRRDQAAAELDSLEGGADQSACLARSNRAIDAACSELMDAQSDFESATTLTNVGFIAAGVGAAAAVATYLFWPSANGHAASLGAGVGPGAAFATVRGAF